MIEDIEMYIYWTTCALRSKAASSPGHSHLAIFLSDKEMKKFTVTERVCNFVINTTNTSQLNSSQFSYTLLMIFGGPCPP